MKGPVKSGYPPRQKVDVPASQPPEGTTKKSTGDRVKSAAGRLREVYRLNLLKKRLGRVLRSRHKLGDFSSAVANDLVEEPGGGDDLTTTRSMLPRGSKTGTRLRKRPFLDQGNGESVKASKIDCGQPEHSDKRRKLHERSGNQAKSLDEASSKKTDSICRRVTRGMDGTSSIKKVSFPRRWTRSTNEKLESNGHSFAKEKSAMRKRQERREKDALSERAGADHEASPVENHGPGKCLVNHTVFRVKMGREPTDNAFTQGTCNEDSAANLGNATNRNADKPAEHTSKIDQAGKLNSNQRAGLNKDALRPVQGAEGMLLSSSGPITRGGQSRLRGINTGAEILKVSGDSGQGRKVDTEEARVGSVPGSKRQHQHHLNKTGLIPNMKVEENLKVCWNDLEVTAPNEKALQMESRRQRKQVTVAEQGDQIDVKAGIASDELGKDSDNNPAGLANYKGLQTGRRKRDANNLSVIQQTCSKQEGGVTQVEVIGPVTRGMDRKGHLGCTADGREFNGGASGIIGDMLGRVLSSVGRATVMLAESVDKKEVACKVNNNRGNTEKDKTEEKGDDQATEMLRRSKRKRISSRLDVAEVKASKQGKFILQEIDPEMGKSIMDHLEDNKEPHFTQSNAAFKEMAKAEEAGAEQQTDFLKGQSGDLDDDHLFNFMRNSVEVKDFESAHQLAHDGMGMNDGACRVDFRRKCFLVATNPTETGGRQMRPRPLDLEQPLLVLVEGRDQNYYDLDGGSFYRMLRQQASEFQKISSDKVVSTSGSGGTSQALKKPMNKMKTIAIPSFRVLPEFEEEQSRLRPRYVIPQSYIRYIARTADDYNSKAEYDMDEEDEDWLHNFNQTMLDSRMSPTISEDQFEKIMEILENKSTELENMKTSVEKVSDALDQDQIPQNETIRGKVQQISEDCCICNGGENSTSNPVFTCTGCHIHVHQSCYGVQESKICYRGGNSGNYWYCRKCEAVAAGRATSEVSCALCCKQGGALKPAKETSKWVHVVCALYTNETFFVNTDTMEPIDGLLAAEIRARKQRRRCWLCGLREGCLERCSVKACAAVFHVSCGVNQGASFELQHSNQQVVYVRSFCPQHANVAPVSSAVKDTGFSSMQHEQMQHEEILQEETNENAELEEKTSLIADHALENKKHQSSSSSQRTEHRKPGRKASTPRKGNPVRERCNEDARKTALQGDHCKCIALRHRMVAPDCAKQRYLDGESEEPTTVPEVRHELASEGKSNPVEKLTRKVTKEQDLLLNLEDALKTDLAPSHVVERVYWYWVSKRAMSEGSLLHRIQQERAAKKFGIFNTDGAEGDVLSPLFKGGSSRRSVMDLEIREKMVAVQQQLQRLQEITKLVIQRERIKLDILSVDQDIAQWKLEAFRAKGSYCFWCKGTRHLLCCTVCNSSFCFQCFRSKKGYGIRSWSAALKLPKFVCTGCQNGEHQEERVFAPKPSSFVDRDGINCQSGQDNQHQDPCGVHASRVNMIFGGQKQKSILRGCHDRGGGGLAECDMDNEVRKEDPIDGHCKQVVNVGVCPTKDLPKKPNILLPHSNSKYLSKSAGRAFWERVEQHSQHNKTVLVSELLNNMLYRSKGDVVDATEKKFYLTSSSKRKK